MDDKLKLAAVVLVVGWMTAMCSTVVLTSASPPIEPSCPGVILATSKLESGDQFDEYSWVIGPYTIIINPSARPVTADYLAAGVRDGAIGELVVRFHSPRTLFKLEKNRK